MTNAPSCKQALLAVLMAVAGVLTTACGGGGDAPPNTGVPPAPPAPRTEPAAVTSVPQAVYADNRRTLAFNRLNEIRSQAGVGLLTQRTAVDDAAQSHTIYQMVNNEDGHTETPGKPGYTGPTSKIRIDYFGYQNLLESTEVTAALPFFTATPPQEGGVNLVDLLMGAPYHRNAMLRAEYADVGFGLYDQASVTRLTIDLARTRANTQGAPSTTLIIWPPDGSTGIPTSMLGEDPSPIQENNGAPAGYPASVQVSSLFWAIDVTRFEIRELSTNALVNTKLLSYATDTTLSATFGDHSFAAALPRSPLSKNTAYKVIFEGTRTSDEERVPRPVAAIWYFTTGSREAF